MNDPIRASWLLEQEADWRLFAAQTDMVDVAPVDAAPHQRYLAHFRCRSLVKQRSGRIEQFTEGVTAGITFRDDHLRFVEPLLLVSLVTPQNIWLPNVGRGMICVGHVRVGISLIDTIYQTFAILSGQNWSLASVLNAEAADYARDHQDLFPIDPRPLKRRQVGLDMKETM